MVNMSFTPLDKVATYQYATSWNVTMLDNRQEKRIVLHSDVPLSIKGPLCHADIRRYLAQGVTVSTEYRRKA